MNDKRILEITVETLTAALAAERGGADRIELCGDLGLGGVTPASDLMRAAVQKLRIPIFAMVRPRAGDFLYSGEEFAFMKGSIAEAKKHGIHGVVLGLLAKDRQIDVDRTRQLVDYADPLPVTFHRAFDESRDLGESLEAVIRTGAQRILTSGGAARAPEATAFLAELVVAADNRIVVIPGSGINSTNITEIAKTTNAREFHSGLSTVLPYGSGDSQAIADEVGKLASALARVR
ncbi:MAG TPA: copper homeostasis protein CutC [Candidatus Saccharimonadales bacterium]|nr:copper homeostasis protein CutC [Candidatus Saccharimonadales bacterium]